MPDLFRVKDKTTGNEYTTALVEDHHEVLEKPAVDDAGIPLPPKPKRDLADLVGGKPVVYGELTNPALEQEIAKRNEGRDDADLIKPDSGKKDDLVAALHADDENKEI